VLSLSTHALLKGTSSTSGVTPETTSVSPNVITTTDRPTYSIFHQTLLHTQPQIYTTLLAASLSTQHIWSRCASLLLQRQDDVNLLRVRRFHSNHVSYSQFVSPSATPRISRRNNYIKIWFTIHRKTPCPLQFQITRSSP